MRMTDSAIQSADSHPLFVDGFKRFGHGYRWRVTVVVITGCVAAVLPPASIAVAIPSVMADFGVGEAVVHWASTAYVVASSICMLLSAWVAGRFGVARAYAIGSFALIAGGVGGYLAPTFSTFVAARLLSGGGAGLLLPLAMQFVFLLFPASQRGRAMGLFGAGVLLAPAIAPVIGGFLIETFSWRAVLAFELLVAVAALPPALQLLPRRVISHVPAAPDAPGLALFCVSILFLFASLGQLSRDLSWTTRVVATLTAAFVFASVYAWRSSRPGSGASVVNFRLFRDPTYTASVTMMFALGAGLYGSTYLIPVYLRLQGVAPVEAGAVLLPAGLGMAVAFIGGGFLADRLSPQLLTASGCALMAISCAGIALSAARWDVTLVPIAVSVVAGRLGIGLMMPSVSLCGLRSVPQDWVPHASGVLTFSRQLGAAAGIAALALSYHVRSNHHESILCEAQRPASEVVRRSAELGFSDAFIGLGLLFGALSVASLCFRSRRTAS
jgi:EmrB/QacA subfamily drug resistance transporter